MLLRRALWNFIENARVCLRLHISNELYCLLWNWKMIKIARHQAFDLAEFFLALFSIFFSGLPTERVRDLDLALRALAKSPPPAADLTFDSRSLHIDFSSSILCVFTFQAQNRETFVLRNYPSGSWVLFFFSAFFKHCFFFLHFCSSVQFSAKLKSMTFWARGLVGRETKYAVRKVQQNMARLVRLNR